jgi:hypothetical protein
MNRGEEIAYRYLRKISLDRPEFEPCGRDTTPDFVLSKQAIEVAELSRRIIGSGHKVSDKYF